MNVDYADDIALLANTPTQAESLLHSLEQAAGGIGLQMNVDKTEYMSFNQEGCIFTLNGGGSRGVMVIVVGNGHSATSSNPGPC